MIDLVANSGAGPTAVTPASSQNTADMLIVVFQPGERRLGETEAAVLGRWLAQRRPGVLRIVMGCSVDACRGARLARLRALRQLLVQSGIAPSNIRCSDDWSHVPLHGSAAALPSDVVWLQASSASAPDDPRAPCTAGEAIRLLEEARCTNES